MLAQRGGERIASKGLAPITVALIPKLPLCRLLVRSAFTPRTSVTES